MAGNTGADQPNTELSTKWLFVGLGVLIAGAGLWRVVTTSDAVFKRLDETTLTYFAVAAALLLLRDVRSLAFGDYKVEFAQTRQIAADAKVTAENAQATALRGGTGPHATLTKHGEPAPQPGTAHDDPWKGVFGGEPIANGRRIDAKVEPLGVDGQLFTVRLRVTSTTPSRPMGDAVQFFLHPSFGNDRPVVAVGPSGAAELVLRAYGAFTVGVLADNGETRLELDLAELPHAPRAFRER
jgi:hypothetical protein